MVGVASVAVFAMLSPASLSAGSHVDRLLGNGLDRQQLAEGAVPDGATVFDDHLPAVARLDPALAEALRTAATDAAEVGVQLVINSGWRSAAYQERLFSEAVDERGSADAAARWVATPERSSHVSGDAVDIGDDGGRTWLSEHGARYGLCQVYANEPWHFELRPAAKREGCPPMYEDASSDPRTAR